jgi:ankyrin repeat protein
MARTVGHYRRLGFVFHASGSDPVEEATFAIAERDGIELHFAVKGDHDPARTAMWVYLRVEDADSIAAEFAAAGVVVRVPPHDTDYQMRELAYIDPDGNLLLFGSLLTRATTAGQPSRPAGASTAAAPDPQPQAFEFATALRSGDIEKVAQLLADDPSLAMAPINSRRPLHLYADAPGHRPNAAAIVSALVEAGADVNAHAVDTWHHETALHWAASNDDVELIDVLLDAGADIEHPGSSIGGGPPVQSALGYAQWNALRRLFERGATIGLSHAAALGLMPLVTSLVTGVPSPSHDDLSLAFWNASRAGQLEASRYLLGRGADRDWQAPWSGQTALDVAHDQRHGPVVAWLLEVGAGQGDRPQTP